MQAHQFRPHSLQVYLVSLFVLVLPFWVLGAVGEDLARRLPINLPLSALMFVCPLLAAVIAVQRDGSRRLLGRILDTNGIRPLLWYLPIICLMPTILFGAYWLMRWLGQSMPAPQLSWLTVSVYGLAFLISATGEQVGWTGYMLEALHIRSSALSASLQIGVLWALIHVIPYAQAHHPLDWIAWQCGFTIALRVLLTWLYNVTHRSLLAPIVCHASYDLAWAIFPNHGSHYDPFIVALLTAACALIVTYWWGPQTLSSPRRWLAS